MEVKMASYRKFVSPKKPGGIINAGNPSARTLVKKISKNARGKAAKKRLYHHVVAKDYQVKAIAREKIEKAFRASKARKIKKR